MSYLNSNTILSNLPIKNLLEQVTDLDKKEVVLKANVQLEPNKDYIFLVRKSDEKKPEFINKTVDVGQKHYYIDVFAQDYVKELTKNTHKVNIIPSEGFISLAVCEVIKPKESKKAKELPESKNELEIIPSPTEK